MRYVSFFILMAIGIVFVWKTDGVVGIFGRFAWAERHLGGAGTYTFYKLLGVALIFLAMVIVTGLGDLLLHNVLGSFFGNISNNPTDAPAAG